MLRFFASQLKSPFLELCFEVVRVVSHSANTAVVATVVCVVSSRISLIPSQLAVGRCSGQRAAESHVGVRFSLPRACVNSELFVLL